VQPDDYDAWENAITPKTKALFFEMIGNPNANIADIEKIVEIGHRHGIPVIVDSTFATPYLFRPFEYGADIIIHAATKFLGGQGNSMAGIVVDSGKFKWLGNERFPKYNEPDESYHGLVFGKDCGDAGFISRLRALILRDTGSCLSPFNAFLVLTGMETLPLRMRRHCDNAQKIAEYLAVNEGVSFVNYPGLPQDPGYALKQKYLPKGAGSVFTFGLKGGREAGMKFINSLKLFENVANVGDTRSLVIHSASTTHSQLSDEQLIAGGITPDTVRLSVGIEDPADLLADLEQAIRAARA
jgi:O-acetylhomoserine (thiol)-lyase